MSRLILVIAQSLALCFSVQGQGVMTTVAGSDWVFTGDGKPALSAPLGAPSWITLDNAGNPVFVDTLNCIIGRIGADGKLSVLAGNGFCGFNTGQGGPATSAALAPTSAAFDAAGNLYIGDIFGIRKVAAGTISLFTAYSFTNVPVNGGPAIYPQFSNLHGVTRDSAGNIYAVDAGHNQVCRFSSDGKPTVVAGSGIQGMSGDGGSALSAALNQPTSLAIDAAGNMYIADTGNGAVRKVSPSGTISTISTGIGATGLAVDTAGTLYIASSGKISRYIAGGGRVDIATAGLGANLNIVADNRGNLLVADSENARVVRLPVQGGTATTLAGNGNYRYGGEGVPALEAPIATPFGLAVARDGTVYFSEPSAHRVHKVSKGILTTVAGTGGRGLSGDGGTGSAALLNNPRSLAADPTGNLYISDDGNNRIRRLTPTGAISTFASGYSGSLAIDSASNLYVGTGTQVIRLDSQGTPKVFAGTGIAGSAGDGGPATSATFQSTSSLAFDPAGNLLIADNQASRTRKVTPQEIISTLPQSVGVIANSVGTDVAGNIYLSDFLRLHRITPAGQVSFWSGPRTPLGDGKVASSVGFFVIGQMASDVAGNVYFADGFNYRIREMLAAPPTIQVSPGTLSLAAPSGGAPSTQLITLQGSLAGLEFQITAKTSDGANWLSVEAASGSTPRVISVFADPSSLAPGTYNGTVTITPAAATPATLTVNLTFTVGQPLPPHLSADRPNLSFAYPRNAAAVSIVETVSNTGGGALLFTANVETVPSAKWLSVSPPSGSVSPGQPVPLTITADPSGLPPGTYTGTLTLLSAAAGDNIRVPVTMTVSTASQGLLLTQTGMSFTAVAQGGIVPPQSFGIVNTGTGSLPWKASVSTLSGGSWLNATPATGTSDRAMGAPQVIVTVNPANLRAGNYYGLVRIDAPGAANTPQVLTAFLQVLPAGSNPGAVVQPTEILFASTTGDGLNGSASSQPLNLYNPGATPLTWRTDSSISRDASGELFVLPQSGSLDPAHPTTVLVQPDYQYSGTLTFEFSDGRVQTVKITNVPATGALSTAHTKGLRPLTTGTCVPTQLMPAVTTLPPSFTVSAGWPVALSVDVMDDCGNPHLSGSVTVNFSNGDAALTLNSLNNGTWQATWATKTNPQQISLSINAINDKLGISGVREVDGSLGSIKDPPSFTQAQIVSAASPSSFVALAPGSIFSVYGDRLAENAAAAQAIPLPTQLGNTKVIIGDKTAPLFYAGQGQINAVVPFGLNPNTTHQLLIQRGLTYSRPVPVDVAPAQPGVFTSNGAAIALAYRGTAPAFLVTPLAPAHAGDVLVLYCGGLGMPSQAVADGDASPPAIVQDSVTATIGDQPAPVAYAGLVAGLVGLYQVNLTVPTGVAPGDTIPVILAVSGQTSPAVALSVR